MLLLVFEADCVAIVVVGGLLPNEISNVPKTSIKSNDVRVNCAPDPMSKLSIIKVEKEELQVPLTNILVLSIKI